MDSLSIDQLIDGYELSDFEIDYGFLNEILNSGTQENPTQDDIFGPSFDITEFDLNVEPQLDQTGGWVKRRKFRRGTIEYALWRQEIKVKNRVSARRSLEKKEGYIRELQEKVKRLEAENKFRRRVMQLFPNSKPAGRLCGLRRAFSTSDFYVTSERLMQVLDEDVLSLFIILHTRSLLRKGQICISELGSENPKPIRWSSHGRLFDIFSHQNSSCLGLNVNSYI